MHALRRTRRIIGVGVVHGPGNRYSLANTSERFVSIVIDTLHFLL